MKKLLLATAFTALVAPSAYAQPIKVDWTGTAYEDTAVTNDINDVIDGVFSNTNWIDSLTAQYRSVTTISDTDNSGTLTAGDQVVTNGGFALLNTPVYNSSNSAALNENLFVGANPSSAFPGDYGNTPFSEWALTFSISNLAGIYDGTFLQYNSGDIMVQAYSHVTNSLIDLFNINITGSDYGVGNVEYSGTVDNVNLDVFYINAPAGVQSFADYNAANDVNVSFSLDQNTQDSESGAGLEALVNNLWGAVAPNTAIITANHSGQVAFQVPEPASIAFFGLGLLGLASLSRRKA